MRAVDKVDNFYEANIELGGPHRCRDKLWFFGAYRKARYDKPIANTFNLPAGVPAPQALRCSASPDFANCEQGISPEKMDNPILRLTWQASQRNKFAVYYDRALRLRAGAMGSNTDPAYGVGRVEHADLRHRFGQVDLDAVVEPAARDRLLVQP